MNKLLEKLYNASDIEDDSDDVIKLVYEDLNKIENPNKWTKLKIKALSIYLDVLKCETNSAKADKIINNVK